MKVNDDTGQDSSATGWKSFKSSLDEGKLTSVVGVCRDLVLPGVPVMVCFLYCHTVLLGRGRLSLSYLSQCPETIYWRFPSKSLVP